jgi:uncharacterized circularly permuted ATP-grasp superfamily protein/uncharacterized alpha-E superfamily protein
VSALDIGSDPVRGGGFDESLMWDAGLRTALLDSGQLAGLQAQVDRLLVAEGAGHLVHDLPVRADGRAATVASRPWRLDPIPVVIDTETFQWLSSAVIERMEALEEVLRDLYGARQLLRDGVVPADVLHSSDRYRLAAIGSTHPARWLTTYAVDLVRDADGGWRVVQDFADAPPGVGYALLDRSVMSRTSAELLASAGIASLARFPGQLRRALAASSPVPSPRTVLFSGGIDHPSYIDHSYLAVQLGVHLVEGPDLVVRGGRLWLRTLDGLEPIDVVYRRLEDPDIDPLEAGAIRTRSALGIPGLLLAARAGGITLANAHGSGVVEDRLLSHLWPAAGRHLSGVELRLPQLDGDRPQLATTPLFDGSRIRAGEVVVRMFAIHDGRTASVMPGGSGRVLAPGDHPALPTACVAKDVWVVGTTLTPFIAAALPQVDFARSVPTRAADALFWTNRACERAEAMARTIGAISSRMEQDPGLVSLDGGGWSIRTQRMTRAIRRAGGPAIDDSAAGGLTGELAHGLVGELAHGLVGELAHGLVGELALTADAIATEIGVLLTEATTVREYLPVTAGRVLERLSNTRAVLQRRAAAVDDLDALLADFAALAGLWNESTVRGPAWRLGDAGRRIERSLVVLDLVESGFSTSPDRDDPVEAAVLEVILAANDSLVAYRRRHRSDVEPDAAFALLMCDDTNPRSVAASIERLGQHAAEAEWPEGIAIAAAARLALSLPRAELMVSVRGLIVDAGNKLVERWFATPVSPIVVVGR